MSISQFEQFKDVLAQAVQDTDFVRKNTLFQDSSYIATVLSRIEALSDDVVITQDYSNIQSSLGLLLQDSSNQAIKFDPKGFETTLSAYREGTVTTPRRIFRKSSVTDGIYYILSDGGLGGSSKGVLMLNDKLELIQRFPNFGTDVAGGEYEDPSAAVHFTISATDYVAIADYTNHVVQIYLYDAPYTKVATIGTVGVSGADATHLSAPTGLAVDETNELMYISNETGQPAGATASNGFVSVWDISTIGTPALDSIPLFYSGTGSLLDSQVHTPVDLFYDGSVLWVSNNGTDTVGAFNVSGSSPVCVRFIETQGPGYILRGPQQVYSRTLAGGFVRLYISNGNTGTIEEFDGLTFTHLATYGIRASEDALNNYTRLSPDVYGALALPHGIVADSVVIDGQTTNVLVVTDPTNGRVHRFNLDAYTGDNFVNFAPMTLDVPVLVQGWSVSGNLPLDMVKVWYRFNTTEEFRELSPDASIPSSRTLQFRLSVQLGSRKFINPSWYVNKVRIHAKQA